MPAVSPTKLAPFARRVDAEHWPARRVWLAFVACAFGVGACAPSPPPPTDAAINDAAIDVATAMDASRDAPSTSDAAPDVATMADGGTTPSDSGVQRVVCPANVTVPSRVFYGNTSTTMITGAITLGEVIAGDPNSPSYFKLGIPCETGRAMQVVRLEVPASLRVRAIAQINYGEGSAYPRELRALSISRQACDVTTDPAFPPTDRRHYRAPGGGFLAAPSNSGSFYFTVNGSGGAGMSNFDLAAGTWYLTTLVEMPSVSNRCQTLLEFLL